MKTPYVDPLIPLHETRDETLTRLSADIATLTGLMNDAERMSHSTLAAMFNRARDAKVVQAEGIIAPAAAGSDPSADDRRFLLVAEDAFRRLQTGVFGTDPRGGRPASGGRAGRLAQGPQGEHEPALATRIRRPWPSP